MLPTLLTLLACLRVCGGHGAKVYMGTEDIDTDPWADASDTWGIPDTIAAVGRVFRITLPEQDNVVGYKARDHSYRRMQLTLIIYTIDASFWQKNLGKRIERDFMLLISLVAYIFHA